MFFTSIIYNSFIFIGSILILLIVLWLIYVEWKEYQARVKCDRQNLRYVRVPNILLALLKNQRHDQIESKLHDKYGQIYGCNFANDFTIVLSNPELVQIICNKEFTNFTNHRV